MVCEVGSGGVRLGKRRGVVRRGCGGGGGGVGWNEVGGVFVEIALWNPQNRNMCMSKISV